MSDTKNYDRLHLHTYNNSAFSPPQNTKDVLSEYLHAVEVNDNAVWNFKDNLWKGHGIMWDKQRERSEKVYFFLQIIPRILMTCSFLKITLCESKRERTCQRVQWLVWTKYANERRVQVGQGKCALTGLSDISAVAGSV